MCRDPLTLVGQPIRTEEDAKEQRHDLEAGHHPRAQQHDRYGHHSATLSSKRSEEQDATHEHQGTEHNAEQRESHPRILAQQRRCD
jgi:hypothetical protein